MSAYAIIKQAVLAKKCITASYHGKIRKFSPHAVGWSGANTEHVMAFQYGGDSNSGLPNGGQWRCFEVSALSNVQANDDNWHTRDDHSKPNTCVTTIDVQVKG